MENAISFGIHWALTALLLSCLQTKNIGLCDQHAAGLCWILRLCSFAFVPVFVFDFVSVFEFMLCVYSLHKPMQQVSNNDSLNC
jgi:hypothetical protein